jgi:hypothetical protein
MEDVSIFYRHLVCFIAIWYILLPFGTFSGYLVYIHHFGMLYKKFWQPGYVCMYVCKTFTESGEEERACCSWQQNDDIGFDASFCLVARKFVAPMIGVNCGSCWSAHESALRKIKNDVFNRMDK